MRIQEVISGRRFGHLLRKEVYDSYRATGVGAAAVAAVVLVIYGIVAYAQDVSVQVGNSFATGAAHPLHIAMLSILLFLGGPIITSRVFRDMHDRIKNHDWLMFPASSFEKFAERWLVSGILFAVAKSEEHSGCALQSARRLRDQRRKHDQAGKLSARHELFRDTLLRRHHRHAGRSRGRPGAGRMRVSFQGIAGAGNL